MTPEERGRFVAAYVRSMRPVCDRSLDTLDPDDPASVAFGSDPEHVRCAGILTRKGIAVAGGSITIVVTCSVCDREERPS